MTHHDNGKINIIFREPKRETDPKQSAKILKHNSELNLIDQRFSTFIGLEHFKEIIKEIYATKLMNSKREEMGLTVNKQVLHMIFKNTCNACQAPSLEQFLLDNIFPSSLLYV